MTSRAMVGAGVALVIGAGSSLMQSHPGGLQVSGAYYVERVSPAAQKGKSNVQGRQHGSIDRVAEQSGSERHVDIITGRWLVLLVLPTVALLFGWAVALAIFAHTTRLRVRTGKPEGLQLTVPDAGRH